VKLILNEFIIDRAAGGPDQQISILQIVQAINVKNHVIVMTPDLISTYYTKIKKYEKTMRELPKAIKAFISLIQDSTKVVWVEHPINLDLPKKFEDDRVLLVAAVSYKTNKLLVTTDEDLIQFLQEESITTKYHLDVAKPEKALGIITQ